MNGLEIEVKFFVLRPDDMRQRIQAMGAQSADGRLLERNWIFEDPGRRLQSRGELLRLRQDNAWHLTYKQPRADDGQFKVRHEMETTLGDGEALRAILVALGFSAVRNYEKWRETFLLGDAHLCLDQLPFGHFLEIESSAAQIRRLAADLDLDWRRRIRGTYLDLFRIVAEEMGLKFSDITFANFSGLTVNLEAYRRRFEAE